MILGFHRCHSFQMNLFHYSHDHFVCDLIKIIWWWESTVSSVSIVHRWARIRWNMLTPKSVVISLHDLSCTLSTWVWQKLCAIYFFLIAIQRDSLNRNVLFISNHTSISVYIFVKSFLFWRLFSIYLQPNYTNLIKSNRQMSDNY